LVTVESIKKIILKLKFTSKLIKNKQIYKNKISKIKELIFVNLKNNVIFKFKTWRNTCKYLIQLIYNL